MTRPVRAWTGRRASPRAGCPVPRLPQLTVAVILACALWPSLATAAGATGTHIGGRTIETSLHISTPAERGPVLLLGSGERTQRGSAVVRRLQRGLTRAGYAPGPVDGRYGPLTAAAVERFQANHGLVADGIVGPRTRLALRAAPALALGAGEVSAHGSPAVAHLQRMLKRAGFSPGAIDGRFGPRTEHAVAAFQRAHHLAVDGIAGATTGTALQASRRVSPRPAGPRGERRAQPSRPAPIRHAQPAPRTRSPRPAQTDIPTAPRLPVMWIVLGLGLLGLTAVLSSYYQGPLSTRAGQVTQAFSAVRKGHATTTRTPVPAPPALRFVIEEDNGGGFYWTIVTHGGRQLAASPRFASYEDALRAAAMVHTGAGAAGLQRRTGGAPPVDLPGLALPPGASPALRGRRR
jgi:peptidoglycan hydrolase-like protein with peptidoglycan-binding domain